jgi:hypothetical protein
MDYIVVKHLDLMPLYHEIYDKHNRSYFVALEVKAKEMAEKMIVHLWIMKCHMEEFHRDIR